MVFGTEKSILESHCSRGDLGELRWIVDCLKEIAALEDISIFFKQLRRDDSWLSFATNKNKSGYFATLSRWLQNGRKYIHYPDKGKKGWKVLI